MPQASQNLLTVKFKDLIYQQRAPSLDEKDQFAFPLNMKIGQIPLFSNRVLARVLSRTGPW